MDPFRDEIRALAPKRTERLLVVGRFPDPFEATEVRHIEDPAESAESATGLADTDFDAIIVRLPERWQPAWLESWRSLLTEKGRLILCVSPRIRGPLVEVLSAIGLVIVHDRPSALPSLGQHLIAARRDEYRLRAYEPGDEQAILELFAPSFHAVRSPDHWRWKFLENPWGRTRITLAFSPDGVLAAHYAGYPVIWSHHDPDTHRRNDFEALQVGDTMTHPAHRSVGRGPTSLLLRSVKHFYARYCEGKVAFNFGFNTGNIRKLSLRYVRAQSLESVGYWRRDAATVGRRPDDYAIGEVNRSDLQIPERRSRLWGEVRSLDRFFDRAAPAYGTLVRRNSAWLHWRYLCCPDSPPFFLLSARRWGRIVGWSVFRRRENRLVWCDALFLRGHERASGDLLATALARPDMEGVESIEAWFSPRPDWWIAELRAQGFESRAEPNDLAMLFVPHAREDSPELLANAYYTMGDGDLA